MGDDADTATSSSTVAGWYSFDANGTLMNNSDLQAGNVDLAFNKRVYHRCRRESQAIYFYIGVCQTQADANAAIAVARSSSGDQWFNTTAKAYNTWLANSNQGRRVHFDDNAINLTFDRALIVIKNV